MIANVYKPPSVGWLSHLPPSLQHPAIYVGDFNSHHPDWGYRDMDNDGEQVAEWAAYNKLDFRAGCSLCIWLMRLLSSGLALYA